MTEENINDFAEPFSALCTEHETGARKLLLARSIKTEKQLAVMGCDDVKDAIDANFLAIRAGEEDWLLIPKERASEFNALAIWISG